MVNKVRDNGHALREIHWLRTRRISLPHRDMSLARHWTVAHYVEAFVVNFTFFFDSSAYARLEAHKDTMMQADYWDVKTDTTYLDRHHYTLRHRYITPVMTSPINTGGHGARKAHTCMSVKLPARLSLA